MRGVPLVMIIASPLRQCRLCKLDKQIDQFYVRKDTGRYRTECKSCTSIRGKEWILNNAAKRRAIALRWAKANYPYIRKKKAEYRARDPLAMRRWALENPDKMHACRKRWDQRNPHRKLKHARDRQARKIKAMPAWADKKEMNQIYSEARKMGSQYEVDHIVPLRGTLVCGLHCEHNLQIITRRANRQKGRFRWPDMP